MKEITVSIGYDGKYYTPDETAITNWCLKNWGKKNGLNLKLVLPRKFNFFRKKSDYKVMVKSTDPSKSDPHSFVYVRICKNKSSGDTVSMLVTPTQVVPYIVKVIDNDRGDRKDTMAADIISALSEWDPRI